MTDWILFTEYFPEEVELSVLLLSLFDVLLLSAIEIKVNR